MFEVKKKYLYFLVFILINIMTYSVGYIESGVYSEEEIEYIEKLKKSGLKIGGYTGSIYMDPESPEDSLAYKYGDIINEFLGIDVKIEWGNWGELYKELKAGDIDMLLDLILAESRKSEVNLSVPLYRDKIYVVSGKQNAPLRYFEDMYGKEIAVPKLSYYKEYLEKFKKEKNIDFKIKEVLDTSDYLKSDYFIISKENIYDRTQSKLELGEAYPIGIGITKGKPALKNIIDKALEFSLRDKFLESLEYEKNKRKKRAFYKFLNHNEAEYLENIEKLEVTLEDNFYPTSYYDNVQKKYDGSFVRLMEYISEFVGIQIEIVNGKNTKEVEINRKEADIRGLLFTNENKEKYAFSKSLIYKDILLMTASLKIASGKKDIRRVGVVSGGACTGLIKKYLPEFTEIIEYSNAKELIEAFKSSKIDGGVMIADMFVYLQQMSSGLELYKVKLLDRVPYALAVNKEDELLLGILNKVIANFLDYRQIENDVLAELDFFKSAKINEQHKNKKYMALMVLLFGSMSGTILMGVKYKTNKNLKMLAYYDHLTTALNRVSFKDAMNKINFKRDKGVGMYVDLDDFKVINENYGHHAGDMVLKEAVSRLQKVFKKDTVYRLAGDEFFIFHKDIEVEDGVELARKAMAELNKPIKILGTIFNIGASIGICELHEKIANLDYFMHKADIAMYTAKKNGRGSIVVANPDLVKEFEESKELEKDFKVALQKNEIVPYFQPKVDLNTNKIVGLEALARWIHPTKGTIPPAVFVPMAEEIGLIFKLDMRIAEITIKTIREWQDKGIVSDNFKASFNVSVQTFDEIEVYEQIKYLLDKYGVSGQCIEIELTESVFIKKFSKILGELNSIKDKLGTSVALDDFTAGYSSLRELGKLNIDSLKFDRSLLQSVKDNVEKGQKIYRTLIRLCNDMEYVSVAEGIEEASESEFLRREGVRYAQGYFFGKPMPERAFIDLLDETNKDAIKEA